MTHSQTLAKSNSNFIYINALNISLSLERFYFHGENDKFSFIKLVLFEWC